MYPRRLCPVLARIVPVATAVAALAACAPAKDQFAPACPQASLLPQAADLTRYRTTANGTGHDLTDLMLQARVTNVSGTCQPGDNAQMLDASVKVTIELTRGPAAPSRTTDIAYFVAVLDGDQILDKKVLSNRVTFPPNVDRIYLTSDPVNMRLTVSPDKTGAAYTVMTGLQYTPAEWAQRTGSGAQ